MSNDIKKKDNIEEVEKTSKIYEINPELVPTDVVVYANEFENIMYVGGESKTVKQGDRLRGEEYIKLAREGKAGFIICCKTSQDFLKRMEIVRRNRLNIDLPKWAKEKK